MTNISARYRGRAREAHDIVVMARQTFAAGESLLRERRKVLAGRLWSLRTRAFDRGLKRAVEEGKAEMREALEAFRVANEESLRVRLDLLTANAVQLVEQFMANEPTLYCSTLSARLSDVLSKLIVSNATIHLSPLDRTLIEETCGGSVITDPAVSPGSALIRTPQGNIEVGWRDAFVEWARIQCEEAIPKVA